LLGPFEEEEEGSGIASDVVKVEGEDPGTPGSLRSVDTRKNPGTVRFTNIGSTKQSNTHTICASSCNNFDLFTTTGVRRKHGYEKSPRKT